MVDWLKDEKNSAGLPVRRVGGSGCGWQKGDQVGDDWLVEVKTTSRLGFRISTEVIGKIANEAAQEGKAAVLRVTLDAEKNPIMVAVVPWEQFILLVEAADDQEEE